MSPRRGDLNSIILFNSRPGRTKVLLYYLSRAAGRASQLMLPWAGRVPGSLLNTRIGSWAPISTHLSRRAASRRPLAARAAGRTRAPRWWGAEGMAALRRVKAAPRDGRTAPPAPGTRGDDPLVAPDRRRREGCQALLVHWRLYRDWNRVTIGLRPAGIGTSIMRRRTDGDWPRLTWLGGPPPPGTESGEPGGGWFCRAGGVHVTQGNGRAMLPGPGGLSQRIGDNPHVDSAQRLSVEWRPVPPRLRRAGPYAADRRGVLPPAGTSPTTSLRCRAHAHRKRAVPRSAVRAAFECPGLAGPHPAREPARGLFSGGHTQVRRALLGPAPSGTMRPRGRIAD